MHVITTVITLLLTFCAYILMQKPKANSNCMIIYRIAGIHCSSFNFVKLVISIALTART